MIASYDLDGVIDLGSNIPGLTPGNDDIIITGRSIEELDETLKFLDSRRIGNQVFFNPQPFNEKTRKGSGLFKVNMIKELLSCGYDIGVHFEDDLIQADIIESQCPEVKVVRIIHNLTEKENVRHI